MGDQPVPLAIEQGARARISGTPRVHLVPGARIVCRDEFVVNSRRGQAVRATSLAWHRRGRGSAYAAMSAETLTS